MKRGEREAAESAFFCCSLRGAFFAVTCRECVRVGSWQPRLLASRSRGLPGRPNNSARCLSRADAAANAAAQHADAPARCLLLSARALSALPNPPQTQKGRTRPYTNTSSSNSQMTQALVERPTDVGAGRGAAAGGSGGGDEARSPSPAALSTSAHAPAVIPVSTTAFGMEWSAHGKSGGRGDWWAGRTRGVGAAAPRCLRGGPARRRRRRGRFPPAWPCRRSSSLTTPRSPPPHHITTNHSLLPPPRPRGPHRLPGNP